MVRSLGRVVAAVAVLAAVECTSPGPREAPPLGSAQQADTAFSVPVACPPAEEAKAVQGDQSALICSDPNASHLVDSAYFVVTGGGNDDRIEKQVAQTFETSAYPSGMLQRQPGSLTFTVKRLFDVPAGDPVMGVYIFVLRQGEVDPTVFTLSGLDSQAIPLGYFGLDADSMPVGADYRVTAHFFHLEGVPGGALTAKTAYSLDFYIPPGQGTVNEPMSVGLAAEDDGTVYQDPVGGRDRLAGFLRQERLIRLNPLDYTTPAFTQDKRDLNFAMTLDDGCDMVQYPPNSGHWINKPIPCGVGACALEARQCNSFGQLVHCDAQPQPGSSEPVCFDQVAYYNATGGYVDSTNPPPGYDAPDCTAKLPAQEKCDLVDNDCDGIVDEIADPTPSWLQAWHFHGLGQTQCGNGVCRTTFANCISGVEQSCVGCAPGTAGCHATVVKSYTGGPNVTVYGDAAKKTNEVCDNRDDDCDGQIDELTDDPNGPGIGYSTCGLGVCRETLPKCTCGTAPLSADGQATALPCDTGSNGIAVAANDQPNVCPPAGDVAKKTAEICDGLDNNCDGVVDNQEINGVVQSMQPDSLTRPYYQGPNGTENVGVCKPGVQACTATLGSGKATWTVTTPDVEPSPDVCDGFDNDCDGYVDNVPGTKANDTLKLACWPGTLPVGDRGVGDCKDGVQYCNATSGSGVSSYQSCHDYVAPTPEVCDGTDNNCNGQIDEGLGQTTCGFGRCTVQGQNCIAGKSQSCVPDVALSEPEVCNGVDDDCDGYVDNAPGTSANDTLTQYCYTGKTGTDGVGICHGGSQSCDAAFVKITPSINNGNGTYTTSPPPYPGTASWGSCQGEQLPKKEVCDGQDDDCDGQIDNPANVICGSAPNASGTLCQSAKCVVSSCDSGWYDVDKQFADGCECQDDASVTSSGHPSSPTNLGSLSLGATVSSQPGKLPAAGLSDWYSVSATANGDWRLNFGFSQNPMVMVSGTSKPEFQVEVYDGQWHLVGGPMASVTEPDAAPPGGHWNVQVLRVAGAPVTCDAYVLYANLRNGACNGQGVCIPTQTQACGNCGTETCNNSCQWGSCLGQGCQPTTTQACNTYGSQTCSSACKWGSCSCSQAPVCAPGSTRNVGCGNCGTAIETCDACGQWGSAGACTNQGVCSPGATKSEACGNCGSETDTCSSSCQWSNGSCAGQGVCAPTATKSESCGNCGSETDTCSSSCQWSNGSCTGQGVCTPGATQACNKYGNQTCTSFCTWGACPCGGGSVCVPGARRTLSCGSGCGTETDTCDSCGQWSPGACRAVTGGTVCRASAGPCQLAATCNGSSTTCPANAYRAASYKCRSALGSCQYDAYCTGASAACPASQYVAAGTVCASASDVCENNATCTGSSAYCPTKTDKPATTLCRPSAGSCQKDAYCTGSSAACPPNQDDPAGSLCQAATTCTNASYCTGSSATCPASTHRGCSPGATQACNTYGTQSCSSSCAWENCSCGSAPVCAPGSTRNVGCGNCGTAIETCDACGQWGSAGACTSQGVCSPGATKSEACGNCGSETDTCSSSCQWSNGSCAGQGVCTPTATKSESCGNCGSETDTCSSSCQWSSGSCNGQGVCSPGATRSEGCGNCGSQTDTCSASCQWSNGSCSGQGVCTPSTTKSESCGNCGSETDTCSASCQWSSGSCNGQGVCFPGSTESCNKYGSQTCTNSCTWGGCSCGGGSVCIPGSRRNVGCGNCGTAIETCDACGQWGSAGACTSQGVCSPGATRSCNTYGTETCSGSCGWESCSCPNSPVCTPGTVIYPTPCGTGGCGVVKVTCNSCGQWGSGVCVAANSGGLCYSKAGPCGENEYCNGSSIYCPAPAYLPSGTSCGSTQYGSWSSCGGFNGTCGESGTQSRSVTTYACSGGSSCNASTGYQSQSCSRNTNGTSCGSSQTIFCNSCGGFSGTCGESGTQSCLVVNYSCSGGSCSGSTSWQTQSCSRNTNGTTCASTQNLYCYGCGGFSGTCGETGTQTCYAETHTCSGGTCGTSYGYPTESCSRNTNGWSCGSTQYGRWTGVCPTHSDDCTCAWPQTRSVTSYSCSGGGCQASVQTQSQSCYSQTCFGYGGSASCAGSYCKARCSPQCTTDADCNNTNGCTVGHCSGGVCSYTNKSNYSSCPGGLCYNGTCQTSCGGGSISGSTWCSWVGGGGSCCWLPSQGYYCAYTGPGVYCLCYGPGEPPTPYCQ